MLINALKRKQPEWFNNADHKSADVQRIVDAFKVSLHSNAMLKARESRIAILSLALDALSAFSQADLMKMLGVTETDIRNASRLLC